MATETFSPFDLAPGKVIAGRWRIERPHRPSGFSSVFEVTDAESGAQAELAVFPGALFEGAEQAQAYKRHCEEWRSVTSPHVVRVREVFLANQSAVIVVSDFPSGQTLRSFLDERKHLEPEAAAELGLQMLAALEEIHGRGLVHGDVKPQTVWVAEPGDSKCCGLHATLVDGGVTAGLWDAKHLGEHTALIGTPFYAPVEQFGGESPDVQSDVYNVATVLFELVTGVLPWPGKTLLEVFQAKLDKRRPSMAERAPKVDVEPELERAIVRGLLADKKERFATAGEFRQALAGALAD